MTAAAPLHDAIETRVGDRIAARYELRSAVCCGGSGTVFYALDRASGAPVAVKVLRAGTADDRARFAREAALLAGLDTPDVVRYLASGVTDRGEPYLIMEWVEGATLRWRIAEIGFTVREAVAVVRRIAGALAAAHRQGIVHRDLKPDNVLLPGGALRRILLIDFGVARRAIDPSITAAGTIVGTPGYMAPEQARGEPSDARTDVFALGCILHECLGGSPAFTGRSPAALRTKVLGVPDVWSPPAGVAAPALAAVLARMMAPAPADRFADGDAAAAALAALGPLPEGRRRPSRRLEAVVTAPLHRA